MKDFENRESEKKSQKLKKAMLFLGASIGAAVAAIEIDAQRIKMRSDPEKGENFSESLGEEVLYVEAEDGAKLYTETVGSGPPIVLVHGWFCDSDAWHYQKKHLKDEFRLITYDLRGHGRSDIPPGRYSIDDLAKDLRAVVRAHCGGEPYILVGHSLGGTIILRYAEIFAEELARKLKGVVLVNTLCSPEDLQFPLKVALRVVSGERGEKVLEWVSRHVGFVDWVKDAVTRTSLFLVGTQHIGFGPGASLTQMNYISEMTRRTSLKGALNAAIGALAEMEPVRLDAINSSGIPVLIWTAEKDKLAKPKASICMHEELDNSVLDFVPGVGHPSYTERYEMFNRQLCDFGREALGRSGDES
ncbi:MAG: alpha/beta hydrolase [Actinomycetota bacterium]|nr:alpha/beta hydrolase [Actinomycetota bacterium]